MKTLTLARDVLSNPEQLIADDPGQLARIAPGLLGLTLIGGGLFGVAVGSYHGGWQLGFAALKMPAVLLAPVVVTVPALRALHAGPDGPASLTIAGLAALVGAARVAILSTAAVPLIWLFFSLSPGYRPATLLMAATLAVVGLPGLCTIGSALAPAGRRRIGAMLGTIGLVGIVIAQTGWLLRPFVVTPDAPLTLLCPIADDVLTGIGRRVVGDVPFSVDGVPVDCAVERP